MTISPQDLERLRHASKKSGPMVIEVDRPCLQCGYNLRGLKVEGGVCPECGRPMKPRKRQPIFADQMSAAPLVWLRGFSSGMLLTALGLTLILAATLVFAFLNNQPRIMLLMALGGLVQWAGAIMVTRPRPVTPATTTPPAMEWYWPRLLARFSQCGWTLGAGLVVASAGATLSIFVATALSALGIAAFVMALLGLLPLLMVLSNLAYWASDTNLAYRLRIASWTVPVSGLIVAAVLSPGIVWWFGSVLGAVVILVVTFGVIILPLFHGWWTVCQTWWMARWVVINHMTADIHQAKMKEKFEKERARAEAKKPPGSPTIRP